MWFGSGMLPEMRWRSSPLNETQPDHFSGRLASLLVCICGSEWPAAAEFLRSALAPVDNIAGTE
jgi:hypothetical protein